MVSLVTMVMGSFRFERASVGVSLDASRRWVTLSNVHPAFVAACDGEHRVSSRPHLTTPPPVDQPGGVTRRLVLASASPVRARVLREAGFAPEVIVSGVAEDDVTGPTAEVAQTLAERKASAVADQLEGAPAIVLGCDTVLDVDGETRGKPPSLDVARAWWASVAGRSATLHSGLCVHRHGHRTRCAAGVATTIVHYGQPTEREMDAYLATGEPLAVAGGFTIDGYAAPFVDRIDGDHGAVLGLSLPLLRRLLARDRHRDHRPVGPMTLHIGPLAVDPPVVLAPMAGVTDAPFRGVCSRFGAGSVRVGDDHGPGARRAQRAHARPCSGSTGPRPPARCSSTAPTRTRSARRCATSSTRSASTTST